MTSTSIVMTLFIIFLSLKTLIELYLDFRNKNYINKHKNDVPEKFKGKVELEDHQKAAKYSITKIKFGFISTAINLIILVAWTLGGGLNYLDNYIRSFSLSNIQSGLAFFAAFAIISGIIGLPMSIYSTFVIEERFGFNKTTPKLFFIDLMKGLLLGLIIGLPIAAGILWIMEAADSLWWLYAWAFSSTIQLVLLIVYPTFIAPLFNKFSELEDGEVKDVILSLLKRTGFSSKGLFVMDASKRSAHGNAYFTGFGKNKRIVFFDTLLKTLAADEVEAVLAHELGHFKKKHILKRIIVAFTMSFLGLGVLGLVYKWVPFYEGHGVEHISPYMALMLFSMVSGAYTFLFTPISSWSSRKHEFEADEFAAKYSDASKLISSLVKMYKDNASTLTPDPVYSSFYHSHPPALIRVQHLEKLDQKE